ncbi:MAG TPA: hypothetical protein VE572_05655, partial [Nitrososphaeraceae archaeon]|nr:hypothetical protein [Nitrososphaeraceae archaeon]
KNKNLQISIRYKLSTRGLWQCISYDSSDRIFLRNLFYLVFTNLIARSVVPKSNERLYTSSKIEYDYI